MAPAVGAFAGIVTAASIIPILIVPALAVTGTIGIYAMVKGFFVVIAAMCYGLSKIEVPDYEPSTEIIKINFEEGICKEEGANNGMAA